MPITTATDIILKDIFIIIFQKKKDNISCESSASQMSHMKC